MGPLVCPATSCAVHREYGLQSLELSQGFIYKSKLLCVHVPLGTETPLAHPKAQITLPKSFAPHGNGATAHKDSFNL